VTLVVPPSASVAGSTPLVLASAVASPASPSTVVQSSPLLGLGDYHSLLIHATLTGATGGPLDVYVQGSADGGTSWVDLVHFAQIAAAAAAAGFIVQLTRAAGSGATPIAVNATSNTPALAANKVNPGDWGDRLRYVFVAGASTSAGAAQTILVSGSY
jgi:hypothetical protein